MLAIRWKFLTILTILIVLVAAAYKPYLKPYLNRYIHCHMSGCAEKLSNVSPDGKKKITVEEDSWLDCTYPVMYRSNAFMSGRAKQIGSFLYDQRGGCIEGYQDWNVKWSEDSQQFSIMLDGEVVFNYNFSKVDVR